MTETKPLLFRVFRHAVGNEPQASVDPSLSVENIDQGFDFQIVVFEVY